jgi:hypothetical protein
MMCFEIKMPLSILLALVVIGCFDSHWLASLASFVLNALIVLFAMIAVYAMITMFVCLDYLPY